MDGDGPREPGRASTLGADVLAALSRDREIDITTIGVRSGAPIRIEIWFHNVDGRIYLTGTPGRRGWYANLLAEPRFEFHLKETIREDLTARAIPITDPAQRAAVIPRILSRLTTDHSVDRWLSDSPLVEVRFEDRG
jgi:F420H(2)-dependent quinone reductase